MRRAVMLIMGLVTCAAGENKGVELKGTLLREGKPLDLGAAPLYVQATRCREADQKTIGVNIKLPAAASPYHVEDIVMAISGTPGLAKLATKLTPQTSDRSYEPARDGWGRVLAWIGPRDRVTQSTLPDKGWVLFHALDRNGPIDVEVDLDFGALGKVTGRVRADKTEEIVCVIPAPPPPPPPPPPQRR